MIRQRKALSRSPLPPRKAWLKRGTKKVPKVNLARARRRIAEYKAFMLSPEWKAIRKAALQRAGFRCEELTPTRIPGTISVTRCPMTTTLTVHHKSYARFGGRELPKDLQVLCRAHHDATEALKGGKRLWQRVG